MVFTIAGSKTTIPLFAFLASIIETLNLSPRYLTKLQEANEGHEPTAHS